MTEKLKKIKIKKINKPSTTKTTPKKPENDSESSKQILLLAQLLPKLVREKPASINTQINGCSECHEGSSIFSTVHVLHTNLH